MGVLSKVQDQLCPDCVTYQDAPWTKEEPHATYRCSCGRLWEVDARVAPDIEDARARRVRIPSDHWGYGPWGGAAADVVVWCAEQLAGSALWAVVSLGSQKAVEAAQSHFRSVRDLTQSEVIELGKRRVTMAHPDISFAQLGETPVRVGWVLVDEEQIPCVSLQLESFSWEVQIRVASGIPEARITSQWWLAKDLPRAEPAR